MRTKGLIDAAVEHVRANASLKTVFGEPVRVDGKMFVPVAKVAAKESATKAAARPIGVVAISDTDAKFVSFGQGKRFAWVAGISAAIGLIVGRVLGRRKERAPRI
jgi:uncharacterized spore protein YtfJ